MQITRLVSIPSQFVMTNFIGIEDKHCPDVAETFTTDWFPSVLDYFVKKEAQNICGTLPSCSESSSRGFSDEMTDCLADCLGQYESLTNWLNEEEKINEQIAYLNSTQCNDGNDDHYKSCRQDLDQYYPGMANTSEYFIQSEISVELCENFCKSKVSTTTTTTAAPTTDSTTDPTASPTEAQTLAPTAAPTVAPTAAPTTTEAPTPS